MDDIFILIPLLLYLWKEMGNRSITVRLWLPAVPLGLIAVYLLYNALVVHALFPTSGAVKAGFALNRNWSEIESVLLPSKGSWVLMKEDRMAGFAERSYRAYLLLVPTLVCAAYLLRRKHRWSLIGMACTGVVLKGLYNLFFVALFNQGWWYFGSSVLIANLVIALWIDRSIGTYWTRWSHVCATYAVAFLLISFSFNAQVSQRLTSGQADWEMAILQRRDVIRSLVLESGGDRFIEMNDGIITYATGMTGLAGTGLALDVEATRAIQNGNLLSLAAKRNYHLMVAAGSYRMMVDEYLKFRARGFRGYMGQLNGQELDHFKLEPVAHDDPTDLTIYRIVPIP